MRLYKDSEKTTFAYWFAHWLAYQKVAIQLKAWRFKYLFHDIEKPWLYLFWPKNKVKKWHRMHADHHLEYPGVLDWEAMIIDWECSQYSKEDAPLNARDTLNEQIRRHPEMKHTLYWHGNQVLNKFHL